MKFLYSILIIFAVFACGEASDSDSKMEPESEETNDSATEVITRTYAVKTVNGNAKEDTLQQMQSITYDVDGKELQSTFYKIDGSVAWIEKFIYDDNGKKIGADYFDKGTKNTIYYAYEVDSKGRHVAYQAYDHGSDALLFKGATRYENFGKLKKDGHLDENGDFVCTFEYTFDDEGKELTRTYIDEILGDRFLSTYEYVDFNDEKEWTKRYVTKKGEVFAIETREFKNIELE